jgi:hypothetical protein
MVAGLDKAYGSDLRRLHCEMCGVGIRLNHESTVRRRRFRASAWLRLPLLTIQQL